MKKKKTAFKAIGATCLAATLVSTWDTPSIEAAEYNFSGSLTPVSDLSSVYFLFSVGRCSGGGTYVEKISDFVQANSTTQFDLTFSALPENLGIGSGFTILALYDAANAGVSIGYQSDVGANILSITPTPEWSGTSLPGSNDGESAYYFYVGATEAEVATALSNGLNTGAPIEPVGRLFPTISVDPTAPSSFTLINFSDASFGGSGSVVEVVPEPSTYPLFGMSAAVFLACGCRKVVKWH